MKAINDELGHAEGDRALVETAEILRRTFRTTDLVARLGGDEFVVLVSEYLDGDGGEVLRRRFLRNVADQRRTSTLPFVLSASIGVTIFDPSAPRTLDAVLEEADTRMYEAKVRRRQQGSQRISLTSF